jgi:hypothetical protein
MTATVQVPLHPYLSISSSQMFRPLLFVVLLCIINPAWGQQGESELQLTLPPTIYAVAGVPMNIYFDSIVLTQSPNKYRFAVACDAAKPPSSDGR